jgi:hypothetical protein
VFPVCLASLERQEGLVYLVFELAEVVCWFELLAVFPLPPQL